MRVIEAQGCPRTQRRAAGEEQTALLALWQPAPRGLAAVDGMADRVVAPPSPLPRSPPHHIRPA